MLGGVMTRGKSIVLFHSISCHGALVSLGSRNA